MRVQSNNNKKTGRRVLRVLLVLLLLGALCAAAVLFFLRRPVPSSEGSAEIFHFRTEEGSGKLSNFHLATDQPFSADHVVCAPNIQNDAIDGITGKGLLFDLENETALFAKELYTDNPPASLAKIMTALVALEQADLQDVIVVEKEDLEMEEQAQVAGLIEGDMISVEELLHALLVYSGNDAANVLARGVSGSQAAFVVEMNKKAQALGMTQTHFSNPSGLHEEDMSSSPYDVYLMMRAAYENPLFSRISRLSNYILQVINHDEDGKEYIRTLVLDSTDLFLTGVMELPENVTILASKTGTTYEAGYCLALVVQNHYGVPHLAVLMGEDTQENLYRDMAALLRAVNN